MQPTTTRDPNAPLDVKIKILRGEIDTLINTARNLAPGREIALAFTHLQRGKMWLGKALGALGSANPYPHSSDPSNRTIEPQADHSNEYHPFEEGWDQVEKVKFMRDRMSGPIKDVEELSVPLTKRCNVFVDQSLLALEEAKMWYGWALDAIRNEGSGTTGEAPPAAVIASNPTSGSADSEQK